MISYLRRGAKEYRRSMTKAQRAASYRKRPFRFTYPMGSEKQIYVKVRDIFRFYTGKLDRFVNNRYPRRGISIPLADSDANIDDFATEFELFLMDMQREFSEENVVKGFSLDFTSFIKKVSEYVLARGLDEFSEYMKTITGSPFYGTVEWWDDLQRQWVQNATARVAGDINVYYADMRKKVLDGIRNNIPYEEIKDKLKRMNTSLTEKKAEFVARDLTGKLNGEIERRIQMSVGINFYLWQTAADERVRGRPGGKYPDAIPSHWAMELLLCDWRDASIVSFDYGNTWVPRMANMPLYHPGGDWRCRCLGTPFSLGLMKAIDEELKREEF